MESLGHPFSQPGAALTLFPVEHRAAGTPATCLPSCSRGLVTQAARKVPLWPMSLLMDRALRDAVALWEAWAVAPYRVWAVCGSGQGPWQCLLYHGN